jgi:hypothetical protein
MKTFSTVITRTSLLFNEHFVIPSSEAAKTVVHTSSTSEKYVVLDFWMFDFHKTCPFIHYKFSLLTCFSFTKFTLSYATDKQTF